MRPFGEGFGVPGTVPSSSCLRSVGGKHGGLRPPAGSQLPPSLTGRLLHLLCPRCPRQHRARRRVHEKQQHLGAMGPDAPGLRLPPRAWHGAESRARTCSAPGASELCLHRADRKRN